VSQYPRITEGIGKLTPELWGRLMQSLRFTEQTGPKLQLQYNRRRSPQRAGGTGDRVILLRVTQPIPFLTNPRRWRYQWDEAEVAGGEFRTKAGGITSGTDGWTLAINPEEAENTTASGGTTSYGIPNNPGIGQSVEPVAVPSGSFSLGRVFVDAESGILVPVLAPSTNALLIDCDATP